MERIAKPLLTALLAWLLTLSTGAVSGYAQGLTCRWRQGQTGRRPYIPGKKGAIFPRDDRTANPSHLLKLSVLGTPGAERPQVSLTPVPDFCLPLTFDSFQPLYLSLRMLII
jgi:hypothetical protein